MSEFEQKCVVVHFWCCYKVYNLWGSVCVLELLICWFWYQLGFMSFLFSVVFLYT